MELGDFFFVFVFLGIAAIAGVIYLIRLGKGKKLLTAAEEALSQGQDTDAAALYKKAILNSNEEMENQILSRLEDIFGKRGTEVDFSDYRTLMDQTRILSKKSSNKAIKEMNKIAGLKKEIIEALPEL